MCGNAGDADTARWSTLARGRVGNEAAKPIPARFDSGGEIVRERPLDRIARSISRSTFSRVRRPVSSITACVPAASDDAGDGVPIKPTVSPVA
jgi:hypothetical protein